MSNQPVPFVLRKLRGNPGKRPMRRGPEPKRLERCPEAPAYLPDYGREEWDHVAPQLWAIGLLTVLDVAPLAAYCASYALWRQASEQLDSLTVETEKGELRRHPLIKVVADAASDMVAFSSHFGLTPVARTRIADGIHSKLPGKFDGLIAGDQ
jgi:P27 family predicted phage terminase small subunit